MTFREFVKERFGNRKPNYSFQIAYDYTILSILEDPDFPDNETDGLEVKKYIRSKQLENELYDGSQQTHSYNRAVIIHFERLWGKYKERSKA